MNRTASHPISLPGHVVVFDYGEVISHSPTEQNRAELLATAGIDPADAEAFWAAYWAGREALDEGTVSIVDYWAGIGAAAGRDWPPETVHGLWVIDFSGWLSINTGTIRVIEDLAAGGTRLALLSNAGPDFSSFFRNGSFGALFERTFVSGELLLVKPDAAIYRHVLDELGISAEEMVFIDNKAENIAGAAALGITGHVFTSPDELRRFLTGLASA
ncbi:MAG: HAD family phosphatase [Leifsonia sp.]